jgi:hypothetical protein
MRLAGGEVFRMAVYIYLVAQRDVMFIRQI